MKKIPTLYVRDYTDPRRPVLTDTVTPGCEWVLDGEGVATRKYDGQSCMWDGTRWWTRRDLKPGKPEPEGFLLAQEDPATGRRFGWEPAEQGPWAKHLLQALVGAGGRYPLGTYELVGPKVNGNPEHFDEHRLLPHADAERLPDDVAQEFYGYDLRGPKGPGAVRDLVESLAEIDWEGVVWHHPDGRMAKIKARDYR